MVKIIENNYVDKLIGKISKPPQTYMFTGSDGKKGPVQITVYDYDLTNTCNEILVDKIEDCYKYLENTNTTTWVNIVGVQNADMEIEKLGARLRMDQLIIKEIGEVHQRPTVITDENFVFLSLKKIYYLKGQSVSEKNKSNNFLGDDLNNHKGGLVIEHTCVIYGKNYVITLNQNDAGILSKVGERVLKTEKRDNLVDTDYLVFSILDAVITEYYRIYEYLSENLEKIDVYVNQDKGYHSIDFLTATRYELRYLRKSIYPVLDNLYELQRHKDLKKTSKIYLKDLINRVKQLQETHAITRDSLDIQQQIINSKAQNRQDKFTRRLTVVATIFLPLTLITGIFGMNFFDVSNIHLNIFDNVYTFAAVTMVVMVILGIFLAVYFKKRPYV